MGCRGCLSIEAGDLVTFNLNDRLGCSFWFFLFVFFALVVFFRAKLFLSSLFQASHLVSKGLEFLVFLEISAILVRKRVYELRKSQLVFFDAFDAKRR